MLGDFMYNTIFRNKRNKTIYVCGDFNVDLLQYDKHRDTNNFIDQLYSLELHPLITRPTRITSHSNTIIDNIYATNVTSCIQSGLIINDMTDHLPIFQITEEEEEKEEEEEEEEEETLFDPKSANVQCITYQI